jgi:phosphate transport system substrate-binding protein
MQHGTRIYSALLLVLVIAGICRAQLPDYRPAQQVSGTIRTCGSPQMADLLRLYEDGFRKLQPQVQFQDDLKSTLTAVSGVSARHADIGLLGREIWPTEEQAFASVTGHAPRVTQVAMGSYDVPRATFALMVFVHRDNPLASLSLEQLARIFSVEASGDDQTAIRTWGDLGLTGPWATRPIHLYGFAEENDKSQIFRRLVFTHGERRRDDLRQISNAPGSRGADAGDLIIRAVSADLDGIGISNVHYATTQVRSVPLSMPSHPAPIAPTRENVASGLYPLTRAVFMVTRGGAEPADTPTLEFLRFVLSRQGREAVMQEGNYLPLPQGIAAPELRELNVR